MMMQEVSLALLVFACLRQSAGSRADGPSRTDEERNIIPISPVQAYRKKMQERARALPVTHAVRPFPISGRRPDEAGDPESSHSPTTPLPLLEYLQPIPIPSNATRIAFTDNRQGNQDFPLVHESVPPAPVYRDAPSHQPREFARSADRRIVFSENGTFPTTSTIDPPAIYYRILNASAREPNTFPASNAVDVSSPPSEQESRIVEFRSCLMRDFEKVWSSPVKAGEVFVPRNEIEATCRGYILKIEQLRDQCMEAVEMVMQAKAKAQEKPAENKSWWRFLTFG